MTPDPLMEPLTRAIAALVPQAAAREAAAAIVTVFRFDDEGTPLDAVRDVLWHRCREHATYGWPELVTVTALDMVVRECVNAIAAQQVTP